MGLLEEPILIIVRTGQIYKKIEPETSKAVIAETHSINRGMHEISTSVYCLSI